MFTAHQLKDIVIKGKILSEKEFAIVVADAQKQKVKIEDHLINKKVVSEDLLYSIAATVLGLPFVNLRTQIIPDDVLTLVPEPIAVTNNIVAFKKDGEQIHVATTDPNDLTTQETLQKETGCTLIVYVTTPAAMKDALKQYHKELSQEFQKMTDDVAVTGGENAAQELPTIRMVDTFLEHAIIEGASDIHIEPAEKEMIIRYRIDGILRPVMTLPKSVQAGIIARIKVLANLKIDEHRLPQDGRFKITTSQTQVSFRVSTIPVFDGEKIVLRLLQEGTRVLSLEQLGLAPASFDAVRQSIEKPHGLLLVTGPTGSGKTTTLYTLLNMLNKPGVNIITIEDPIEYRMPGVNQSQVNPKIGFTFATGLRAFLRQDPNVIMVGEIRDTETAEIAIHAALTGHLVLSTLHTNDAVTSIARLLDMGAPAFLVSSTLVLIIAQRLVRKICPNCISSYTLDKKAITELERHFNMKEIIEVMAREKTIASTKETLASMLFYRGNGCNECHKEGYKGRVGIYEILEISPAMGTLILHQPTREELFAQAKKDGMITLAQEGFMKAKNGITTIEELIRVTKE
ncbi:MAG: ATPase, T2SS/T4P/T4SS family [bacterium]|nr:ATPase, T2SS/T4P/T4SS family [bacterium]